MVAKRVALRQAGQWDAADSVRSELERLGVFVIDHRGGSSTWEPLEAAEARKAAAEAQEAAAEARQAAAYRPSAMYDKYFLSSNPLLPRLV